MSSQPSNCGVSSVSSFRLSNSSNSGSTTIGALNMPLLANICRKRARPSLDRPFDDTVCRDSRCVPSHVQWRASVPLRARYLHGIANAEVLSQCDNLLVRLAELAGRRLGQETSNGPKQFVGVCRHYARSR